MPSSTTPSKIDIRKTLADDPVLQLTKLVWEISEMVRREDAKVAERIYMSLNAASTAWHIHEWVWKLAAADVRAALALAFELPRMDAKAFGVACQRRCMALLICRQISIATKHLDVDRDREDVYVEVWNDETLVRNRCTIKLHCEGQAFSDLEVYMRALEWWADVYVQLGFENVDAVDEFMRRVRSTAMR